MELLFVHYKCYNPHCGKPLESELYVIVDNAVSGGLLVKERGGKYIVFNDLKIAIEWFSVLSMQFAVHKAKFPSGAVFIAPIPPVSWWATTDVKPEVGEVCFI